MSRGEVECAIVGVEGRVGGLRSDVTSQQRDGVRIGQRGGLRMSLFDLQVGLPTALQPLDLARVRPDSPIQIRCLDIAQSIRLTAAQENHICGNEPVRGKSYDISDAYSPPGSWFELLIDQYLSRVVVEGAIRVVTFLAGSVRPRSLKDRSHNVFLDLFERTCYQHDGQRHDSGPSSSWRDIWHLLDNSCVT